MSHKVFICYDPNDEEISTDISSLLELNDIKTWIKSRDYHEDSKSLIGMHAGLTEEEMMVPLIVL